MKIKNLLFASCISLAFASCSKDAMQEPVPVKPNQSALSSRQNAAVQAATVITEDFETGSKSAYAAADITLSTGSWNLDDALIGSTASDVKSGTKSVRIRNTGTLSMNFNVSNPTSVNIKHAVYGSDNSSTWQLWVSNDNGSTYAQTGSTITTSSSQLTTATFAISATGNLTFQVRKVSGGTNRINIDDISFSTGGGTVPPDPGTGGTPGNTTDNNNLLLGNPTNAQPSINSAANYLMDQTYYTESYNRDKGTPNWVSWHISSTDLGSSSRANNFRADINLPSGWYQVSNTSYSGSGFDRGHNCPSGDRTSDNTANSSTFLMTNMIPQAPKNNQQTWAGLENYVRTLVQAGSEVYVVMGSYGSGGTGTNGYQTTIDGGNVNVPSHIWKVVVVLPNGNNDLSRISTSTRVIAVDTPNDQTTVSTDWKQYLTTVKSIEAASGVNLMSNVSQSIQDVLKSRTDQGS
ncbi:DNA/RNA non-specific endonuclease [Pedobacter cryoconitis]|uniref:Endonuclease G n=1 Tax=Pedobacter cryoconitis TaxID=188932 RepID=A0A7X0MGU5_9SPHI|nr:DNA/RNA non-specific endonuclease [Pedobacter cryoconitis]MBB6498707.1 endonuclease G [Pedobacter cryoconitis]